MKVTAPPSCYRPASGRRGNEHPPLAKTVMKLVNTGFRRVNRKLGTHRRALLTLVDDHTVFPGSHELASRKTRQTCLSSPLLYDKGLEIIRQPAIKAAVPDVHLLELRDVSAVGGTLAIIRDDKLLHPELLHTTPVYDSKAPDIYRFADARRRSVDLGAYCRLVGKRRIAIGLHLLKEHSCNYYHWLFECLPRLVFFLDHYKKAGKAEDLAVLIDEGMSAQGLDALEYVLSGYGLNRKAVKVGRGESVFCDRLYYVSPFWHSLDNSRHPVDPHRDYVVDQEAVQLTRNAFQGLMSHDAPQRKVYLPRKSTQIRRIINAQEVEELAAKMGFEPIYPDRLSLREQIELFSSASIVIGATGAAFSNLVFMQPGTKAVIFSPNQQEIFNYYLFQQQADVAQVALAHLLTVPAKKDNFYVHDDFYVNSCDLTTLLQQLTCAKASNYARCA
jgi:hypothetical protein